MKTYEYIGVFKSAEGHEYQLTVNCNGFLDALFLLTADAIRSGRHSQLDTITCTDNDRTVKVKNVNNCSSLLID